MVLKKLLALTALVVFISACKTDAPPNTPANPNKVSEAEAMRLYTIKCSLCHGPEGNLMIGGAPDLTESRAGLEERIAIITYGKGTMPPQKGVLTSEEIAAVAAYAGTFAE